METNNMDVATTNALHQAAANVAGMEYPGDDNMELMWSFVRVDGVSKGAIQGIEGVDNRFWVDARVWVSDDTVLQEAMHTGGPGSGDESRRVPDFESFIDPSRVTPTTQYHVTGVQDHFDNTRPIHKNTYPAVYFGPQEIRGHFESAESDLEAAVFAATEDELWDVGKECLGDDRLWIAFHEVLVDVVTEKLVVNERDDHLSDWRHEVAENATVLGFYDWVAYKREAKRS